MKLYNISDKRRIAKTYLFCLCNYICYYSPTPRVISRKDDFIYKSQFIPILLVCDNKLFGTEPSFYTHNDDERRYCYTPSDLLDIYCDNYQEILNFYVDNVTSLQLNEAINHLFPYELQ